MKFSTILVVIIAALLDTEAKPSSLYHVGIVGQVVPALYRTPLLLGHRRNSRCFENLQTNCPISSQNLSYTSRLVTKIDKNQSKTNSNEQPKYQRSYNGDHRKTAIFKGLLALINNQFSLKLEQPNMKYIEKYLPILIEKIRSEIVENKETSSKSKEANTIDLLIEKEDTSENLPAKASTSEKADTIENPFGKVNTLNNVTKSQEILDNWYEIVETLKTSIEKAEATSEFVENIFFTTEENLHQECIFNKSVISVLDQFERKLYTTNFNKFLAVTPTANGDSGMSFIQSGLFLEMSLMALSTEVDLDTKNEIDQNLEVCLSDLEKNELINQVMLSLPNSSEELKYYRSSRLVLRPGRQLSQQFSLRTAKALQLKLSHFEDAQTPEAMAEFLNRMIENDSDGAIRDTFDEEDLSENEEAVLITTLYFRARWHSDPTLLNGTWDFQDTSNTTKTVRMIRINDIMKYVDLPEWDAEAIEIPYLTNGLSLLMIVPRGNSLKRLVEKVTSVILTSVYERMQSIRIAVSLPLYTLRMTLLLPDKLQVMKISRIVNTSGAQNGSLRISQAVQRIMFWAEAGRNAYKDDGLEWNTAPKMNIVIDRPYIFFVRWKNISLMIGNFVL